MQQVSRTSTKLAGLVGLLALTAVGTPAFALPVYDTNVLAPDFTGSRTEFSGQLIAGVATGRTYQTDSSDFTIGWVITQPNATTYHYQYTFSGYNTRPVGVTTGAPSPDISHVIIDLSDICVTAAGANPNCEYHAQTGTPTTLTGIRDTYTLTSQGGSNVGLAGTIIGVKYNSPSGQGASGYIVEFDSDRAPVWGDVYVKGGSTSFVYNAGLTLHGTSTDKLQFIARPDTQTSTVPEPASLLLLGSGLVAMGLVRRKK
jgi:hypothetical protein